MMQSRLVRQLHTTIASFNSTNFKSSLAKLRKKTGYTFSNCKKALELNGNDVSKAEKWLQEQAQALGWSKLAKVEGRVTAQGLVGIAFDGKKAAMVEVNCETDFVARNKYFKEMTELASRTCLENIREPSGDLFKTWLHTEQLKALKGPDNKTLSEHAALLVSSVGENIVLKRALCIGVKKEFNIACYVHPATDNTNNVSSGKYGAIITYSAPKYNSTTDHITKQLCQHVVGMNPKTIYKTETEGRSIPENTTQQTDEAKDEEVEEDAMMAQDFLLDPTLTVGELIEGSGIKVLDFCRFETGEKFEMEDDAEPKLKATRAGG